MDTSLFPSESVKLYNETHKKRKYYDYTSKRIYTLLYNFFMVSIMEIIHSI